MEIHLVNQKAKSLVTTKVTMTEIPMAKKMECH